MPETSDAAAAKVAKPTPEMEKIVLEGVVAFAEPEQRLAKAKAKIAPLEPLFRRGYAAGMMGLLQTNAMCAKASAAAGLVAQAELLIAELHIEATAIAVAKGCDVPQPAGPLSGGGGR